MKPAVRSVKNAPKLKAGKDKLRKVEAGAGGGGKTPGPRKVTLAIDALKQAGAFTGAPVPRDITWMQGDELLTATVYVRALTYRSAVSDLLAAKEGRDPVASRIAACICDESGTPVFTPEDITGEADPERGPLAGALAVALLGAIGEVSRLGKAKS